MSSVRTVKLVNLVVNNILIRLFQQGIHIRECEWLLVRDAALEAQRRKLPLIFLPCHKSHVDYLVISYVLYRMGVAIPHIAAGDNLSLPVVGNLMKCCGAFFIKRTWSNDTFYSQLVSQYIEILLKHGFNLEFFIEGTRSRIGKLLAPKLGILKIIVECVLSGKVEDAILVPISTGYDKIIETSTYVSELMGQPKESESLGALVKSTRLLGLKWGRIDVRFNKPYSLQRFLQLEVERRGGPEAFDPLTNAKDKSTLLLTLGYRILAEINEVSVIMATALVGTIILTLRGRAIGRGAMIRRVKWLRKEILSKNGRTTAESHDTVYLGELVDQSISIMRDFITVTPGLVEPVYTPTKRFELAYYRNQVLHLFLHESILAAAMYGTLKRATQAQHEMVPRELLEDDTKFLSQLLKSEFIFKPGGFEQNMEDTVIYLVRKQVIEVSDGCVALHPREKEFGRENYDFFCFLVWPFIETYWLAAVSLFLLLPGGTIHFLHQSMAQGVKWVEEKTFIAAAQTLGQNIYAQGDMTYRESINKEILLNALKRFQQFGIVQMYKGDKPPTDPSDAMYSAAAQSRVWQKEATVQSYLSSQYLQLTQSSLASRHGVATGSPKDSLSIATASAFFDEMTVSPSTGSISVCAVNAQASAKKESQIPRVGSSRKPGVVYNWIRLFPNWCFSPPDKQSILTLKNPSSKQALEQNRDDYIRMMSEYRYRWPRSFANDFFSSRLWNLADSIGRFRREGKQRRDNSISAERVLCMAGVVEYKHLSSISTSFPVFMERARV